MNEQQVNEIEERLRAMRPAEPDPALRQRLGQSFLQENAEPVSVSLARRHVFLALAVAAALAIAGLVVVQALHGPDSASKVVLTPPVTDQPQDLNPPPPTRLEPTVVAMNRALSSSERDMEALLDQIDKQRALRWSRDTKPVPTPSDAWHQPLKEGFP